MHLIDCTFENHAPAILAILNEAILHSTAIYDYNPRTLDNMVAWFASKTEKGFPILGMVSDSGELMGFATYDTFRMRPAYKYSVEDSVYVHTAHRGKGVGKTLLAHLIGRALLNQLHVMVAGIDKQNLASIALHEQAGFTYAGTIEQAGFKFGRWLDLAFYQLILPTPDKPVDG